MNIRFSNRLLTTLLLSILATLVGLPAKAQNRSVPLLGSPTDARSLSMGGATLMSTDRSYLYVNPTSIFISEDTHLTTSATEILFPKQEGIEGRMYNATLSLGWRFLDRHAIYGGFRTERGLTFPKVTDQYLSKSNREIHPFEYTLDLGYAFKINDRFAAFGTASFIQSYFGRSGYAGAFGLGANYHTPLSLGRDIQAALNVAARVADFGTLLYYSKKDAYALPSKAELTADLSMGRGVHCGTIVLAGRYYFLPTKSQVMQMGIGAEYLYNGQWAIRAGYQYGTKHTSIWTAGAGVKFYGIMLDLALYGRTQTPTDTKAMMTLTYDF